MHEFPAGGSQNAARVYHSGFVLLGDFPSKPLGSQYHAENPRNIVVGAGFSGHGFKLAPLVGRVLAQLALDEKSDVNLSPFLISRFL